MSRGPPAASPCRGRARCSQTRPCARLGGGEPGMGATRSLLVQAGASPQQGLFNKIELFPSSMPPPCPGPGSAWAQRCRPRPQQGQEPPQSGLRGFHRVQQFRQGTRTAGCQGKTPCAKGESHILVAVAGSTLQGAHVPGMSLSPSSSGVPALLITCAPQ